MTQPPGLMNVRRLSRLAVVFLALGAASADGAQAAEGRVTLSLEGEWEMAQGAMAQPPVRYDHRVPVPGLVDMAEPAFAEVGQKSELREAFWYRRTVRIPGAVPAVARLKIHKAAYGTRVYLNGKPIGEHLSSFRPGYFDLREALLGNGEANELVVRVGASRDAVPPSVPSGFDFEKKRYIPGIYDRVELVLSGTPHLVRVQTAPDLTNRSVRVQALVRNAGAKTNVQVTLHVRAAGSGKLVGTVPPQSVALDSGAEQLVDVRIPLDPCRLWSPEDPFLHELEVSTGTDAERVRFGMREFRFDRQTGRAMLNGRPYYLRGSNVAIQRFFEDPLRGDLPWREEWVRQLHRRFRDMHWNCLRYYIGFPPELWYRIADEEGLLIQDEFPLWYLDRCPPQLKRDELAREYAGWMQERWNHPCVVIWDAQNETRTDETGAAIQMVRGLDLSNRPWDNGWGAPQAPGDCFESHPYLFQNPQFRLADVADVSGVPRGNILPNKGGHAVLVNEYAWLWLNRDGTPTTLTQEIYGNLLGPDATPEQRRYRRARYLAALTEFWRSQRTCAGLLHFCGLSYSRPDGQTSDSFSDVQALTLEPFFEQYVRDAFAPVGVMIDHWAEEVEPGQEHRFVVYVSNDLPERWKGTVRLWFSRGPKLLQEKSALCDVPPFGRRRLTFTCDIPQRPGDYQLEAVLLKPGFEPVRSLRDFKVLPPEENGLRRGVAPRHVAHSAQF